MANQKPNAWPMVKGKAEERRQHGQHGALHPMRTIIKTLLTLAVLVAIAWLGLWYYAQARLQSGVQSWVARMQSQGDIKISYDSMSPGTSPLAASVSLANVAVTIQPDPSSPPVILTLPSFALRIDAASPLVLHVGLPAQVNLNTPRADLAITTGSDTLAEQLDLHAILNHEPNPFKASDALASNINILASSGSLLLLHIDSLAAHGTVNRNAGANANALTVSETLKGIALSPLLTRLASIPFGGKVSELDFGLNLSGPVPDNWSGIMAQINALPPGDNNDRGKIAIQTIHGWAAQGGNGNSSLTLILGPTTLAANGTVKFDSNAQPSGTASLTADHLDAFSTAITNAYPQTQNTINALQARLSPDLSSTDAGGQTLNMQVTYGNGSVTVNGQTNKLAPINWNMLENPPPPAPGDGSGATAP